MQKVRFCRSAMVLAGLLLALSACAKPAARITLVLDRAEGAVFNNAIALRVNVRDLDSSTPEIFPTFTVDAQEPRLLNTTVPVDTPFYVDIWGCEDEDACLAADLIARGCTNVIVLESDADVIIGVFMDDSPPADGVDDCPPVVPDEFL